MWQGDKGAFRFWGELQITCHHSFGVRLQPIVSPTLRLKPHSTLITGGSLGFSVSLGLDCQIQAIFSRLSGLSLLNTGIWQSPWSGTMEIPEEPLMLQIRPPRSPVEPHKCKPRRIICCLSVGQKTRKISEVWTVTIRTGVGNRGIMTAHSLLPTPIFTQYVEPLHRKYL